MSEQLTVQQPQAISTLEIFSALARDASIPIERIQQLIEMQEHAEDRQAERDFNAAFSRLQLHLPRVVKRGRIDLGKGKPIPFARWEDVDSVVRPILAGEGMALSFPTKVLDGATVMVCRLSHVGGHSKESEMAVPQDKGPGRNDLQAWGSGRQYVKRYLACDLLNIVTVGEDDDGRSSGQISQDQVLELEDLMRECRLSPHGVSKFLETFGVKSAGDIQKGAYKAAVNLLTAKLRNLKEKD